MTSIGSLRLDPQASVADRCAELHSTLEALGWPTYVRNEVCALLQRVEPPGEELRDLLLLIEERVALVSMAALAGSIAQPEAGSDSFERRVTSATVVDARREVWSYVKSLLVAAQQQGAHSGSFTARALLEPIEFAGGPRTGFGLTFRAVSVFPARTRLPHRERKEGRRPPGSPSLGDRLQRYTHWAATFERTAEGVESGPRAPLAREIPAPIPRGLVRDMTSKRSNDCPWELLWLSYLGSYTDGRVLRADRPVETERGYGAYAGRDGPDRGDSGAVPAIDGKDENTAVSKLLEQEAQFDLASFDIRAYTLKLGCSASDQKALIAWFEAYQALQYTKQIRTRRSCLLELRVRAEALTTRDGGVGWLARLFENTANDRLRGLLAGDETFQEGQGPSRRRKKGFRKDQDANRKGRKAPQKGQDTHDKRQKPFERAQDAFHKAEKGSIKGLLETYPDRFCVVCSTDPQVNYYLQGDPEWNVRLHFARCCLARVLERLPAPVVFTTSAASIGQAGRDAVRHMNALLLNPSEVEGSVRYSPAFWFDQRLENLNAEIAVRPALLAQLLDPLGRTVEKLKRESGCAVPGRGDVAGYFVDRAFLRVGAALIAHHASKALAEGSSMPATGDRWARERTNLLRIASENTVRVWPPEGQHVRDVAEASGLLAQGGLGRLVNELPREIRYALDTLVGLSAPMGAIAYAQSCKLPPDTVLFEVCGVRAAVKELNVPQIRDELEQSGSVTVCFHSPDPGRGTYPLVLDRRFLRVLRD